MPSKLNPYINFDSKTKEAMEFYQQAFGGELNMSTYQDGGVPHDPNESNNIMHSALITKDGMTIMAADTPKSMQHVSGDNISLSLSGDNEPELKGYWDKLSEGGKITVPLAKAPWGDTFGMLVDKFGINWLINISGKKA